LEGPWLWRKPEFAKGRHSGWVGVLANCWPHGSHRLVRDAGRRPPAQRGPSTPGGDGFRPATGAAVPLNVDQGGNTGGAQCCPSTTRRASGSRGARPDHAGSQFARRDEHEPRGQPRAARRVGSTSPAAGRERRQKDAMPGRQPPVVAGGSGRAGKGLPADFSKKSPGRSPTCATAAVRRAEQRRLPHGQGPAPLWVNVTNARGLNGHLSSRILYDDGSDPARNLRSRSGGDDTGAHAVRPYSRGGTVSAKGASLHRQQRDPGSAPTSQTHGTTRARLLPAGNRRQRAENYGGGWRRGPEAGPGGPKTKLAACTAPKRSSVRSRRGRSNRRPVGVPGRYGIPGLLPRGNNTADTVPFIP